MPETITISRALYGPSPYYPDTGGNAYYTMDVAFSGAPPTEFNYTIDILDKDAVPVRTLSGTVQNPSQSNNQVAVAWNGKDAGGQQVDYGSYRSDYKVTAIGYDNQETGVCGGLPVPPPSNGCDDPP